jgi:hypothetical protein
LKKCKIGLPTLFITDKGESRDDEDLESPNRSKPSMQQGRNNYLCVAFSHALSALPQAASRAITLDGDATILVDSQQPVPVQRAAQDLASDMQKVFGHAPRIVSTEQEAGPVSIVLGDEASGAPADHDSAPEAFSITAGSAMVGSGHTAQVIRLAGSDMRGTLFAIYQFSQQYLGVDPMSTGQTTSPPGMHLFRFPPRST